MKNEIQTTYLLNLVLLTFLDPVILEYFILEVLWITT